MATLGGDRPRPRRAAKVASWSVRAGAVMYVTLTPPPEAREGAGHLWRLPGDVGAVRGPQSRRGCCGETVGPT